MLCVFDSNNYKMVRKINISEERKKIIKIIFFIFLTLAIFYKWQTFVANKYLSLGDENFYKENYNEALKNYQYTSIIDGNRDVVYKAKIKRAEIFYQYGELENSRLELVSAIEVKKSASDAYVLMGDIYYAQRNISNAIVYYDRALQIENMKETRIKLGKSYLALKEIEKANDIFNQLHFEYNDTEILYYLGLLALYDNVEYNSFFQEIKEKGDVYGVEIKKIEEFSNNYRDLKENIYKDILIADLYNKINQPYLAISKIENDLEDNSSYRDAWMILGKANFIIGDFEKSYDHFQKASELDSHNSEIIFWLESSAQKAPLRRVEPIIGVGNF